ncbi:hypothetical protein [Actinomadura fibrosa]|uniref:Tetratricopeptide repeat protein n=1 Tax=Actinomadura fibrosa TaxID=111802 RepID=A0ABW2XPP7_9ACTN|nr:hypothetical protein [Actinomadura fibrosa]
MTITRGLEAAPAARDDAEASLVAGERALLDEGDLRTGRIWFDAAYREAERHGDAAGMARAALGLGGLWLHEHRLAAAAEMVRTRQRAALALLDPGSPLALRLRIRLAAEDDYATGGHAAILALVAEARQAGDPVPLAEALSLAHHCLLGPEHGALRLGLARELIGEASRTGRRSDLLMGLLWHAVDLFDGGDPQAERGVRELRDSLGRRDHLAVGIVLDSLDVMLAIREGRFAEAEELAGACLARGEKTGDAAAAGFYAAQIGTIRWYQGRIAECLPALTELVASPDLSPLDNACYAGLAVAAAHSGDRRLAEGSLARLRGRVQDGAPRSCSWLFAMYGVAEAANLLGDAEAAAQAYELLAPFADLPVTLGLGGTCLGSVHHSLGVAALTTGDADTAVEHLVQAVEANLALWHWPAVVVSRTRLAEALALRDGPRSEAARAALEAAAEEAARLGMPVPAGASGPVAGAGRPRSRGIVCERQGRRWSLALGHRAALVGDSVGMRHLAVLIGNPGREIPAISLATGPAAAPGDAASVQPVLDEEAKRRYKRRLAELEAEIEEHEAAGRFERAEAVGAERDWLIAELASASGLGGRTRRFTDSEERARIAVGKAIRRALKHVADADAAIGAELRATIQTGTLCSYRPG